MAYEPTNWKAGDVVTSAKLNKIEQGIVGAGPLIVHVDDNNNTLDKTWQEIFDAGVAYIVVQSEEYTGKTIISLAYRNENGYRIGLYEGSDYTEYSTDSPNGYPTLDLD